MPKDIFGQEIRRGDVVAYPSITNYGDTVVMHLAICVDVSFDFERADYSWDGKRPYVGDVVIKIPDGWTPPKDWSPCTGV